MAMTFSLPQIHRNLSPRRLELLLMGSVGLEVGGGGDVIGIGGGGVMGTHLAESQVSHVELLQAKCG